jgi:general secretion pathway protein K
MQRRLGQRGAALLTAMIIVTLVATLATAMVWQQWRAVQVESAERARAQAAWILSGALDYALLILKNTAPASKATTLDGLWATPLAESRLSTFLAVDKSNADDGPEAFLSGNIIDAQGRYNLDNLVRVQGPAPPNIVPEELETLRGLCRVLNVDSSVPERIAHALLSVAQHAPDAPLKPLTVAQLTWFGVDAASVQTLRPYVTFLGPNVALNVNTAPKEVLEAIAPNRANELSQVRLRKPFQDAGAFRSQAELPGTPASGPLIGTTSNYFEASARLRVGDRVLVERALLKRGSPEFTVQRRERISSVEQSGN